MIKRWRVIIKVWDKSGHMDSDPVCECHFWHDIDPTGSLVMADLEDVMTKPRFAPDHFHGEATVEAVWHTTRTGFVAA